MCLTEYIWLLKLVSITYELVFFFFLISERREKENFKYEYEKHLCGCNKWSEIMYYINTRAPYHILYLLYITRTRVMQKHTLFNDLMRIHFSQCESTGPRQTLFVYIRWLNITIFYFSYVNGSIENTMCVAIRSKIK